MWSLMRWSRPIHERWRGRDVGYGHEGEDKLFPNSHELPYHDHRYVLIGTFPRRIIWSVNRGFASLVVSPVSCCTEPVDPHVNCPSWFRFLGPSLSQWTAVRWVWAHDVRMNGLRFGRKNQGRPWQGPWRFTTHRYCFAPQQLNSPSISLETPIRWSSPSSPTCDLADQQQRQRLIT